MRSILISSVILSIVFVNFCFTTVELSTVITKWNSSPINDVRYNADYEIHLKNSSDKIFIAYIIEEGDLFIKKKCKCVLWNECDQQNTIKLSK